MTTSPGRPPARPRRSRTPRPALLVLVLAVLLPACGSGEVAPGGVLSWRELTVDLPEQWIEISRTQSSLTVADAPGSTEEGVRGDQQVATQFTVEPSTTADDWRRFVEEQEGELERDTEATVGGLPATLIQYSFTTNGIPLRERVLVVPSRDLVILQQPTPMQGETGGPEWFDAHVGEFDALLDNVEFGAPEDFLEDQ